MTTRGGTSRLHYPDGNVRQGRVNPIFREHLGLIYQAEGLQCLPI